MSQSGEKHFYSPVLTFATMEETRASLILPRIHPKIAQFLPSQIWVWALFYFWRCRVQITVRRR